MTRSRSMQHTRIDRFFETNSNYIELHGQHTKMAVEYVVEYITVSYRLEMTYTCTVSHSGTETYV